MRNNISSEEIKILIIEKLSGNILSGLADADRNGTFPAEVHECLKKENIYDTVFSITEGLLDPVITVSVELSAVCAGAGSLFTVNSAGMFPLLRFMDKDKVETLIKDKMNGRKLIGYALSGLDHKELQPNESIAYEKSGEGFKLSGRIEALLMGDRSSGFVVLACDDPDDENADLTAFYIASDQDGVKFGENKELLGLRALPVCCVDLDNCMLPVENIVGKESKGGDVVRMTEAFARVLASAQCLGIIRSSFRNADEFGKQRKQFGTYIGE
ncbi:hypothetical protein ACFL6O_06250, partial [candidate division KSB1 bacterium]